MKNQQKCKLRIIMLRTIKILALPVCILILMSCVSSRDIYGPKFTSKNNTPNNPRQQHLGASSMPRPDWVSSMGQDFIIGVGRGESLEEAQSEAISDVKVKIARSIGESVSVVQYTVTGNSAKDRNSAVSESVFIFEQHLKSKFKPIIGFKNNKIRNTFHEESHIEHIYFIQYGITDEEIAQIKQEHIKQAKEFDEMITRLIQINSIDNLEELIDRYYKLEVIFHTLDKTNKRDSIRIRNAINNIQYIVDELNLRMERISDKSVELQIVSLGKVYQFSGNPIIEASSNIEVTNITFSDDNWEIGFTFNDNAWVWENSIRVRVEYFPISIKGHITLDNDIKNNNKRTKHSAEKSIMNASVIVSEMNTWNGRVQKVGVKVKLRAEAVEFDDLTDIGLKLYNAFGQSIVINYQPQIKILDSNVVLLRGSADVMISTRFLRQVKTTDITINYKNSGILNTMQFDRIPLTIKNL